MPVLLPAVRESLTPGVPDRPIRWGLAGILAFQLALSLWLGWPEPNAGRWWDERFNVHNIQALLRDQGWTPANGYYGGVSYVPQTLVLALARRAHDLTGWRALAVLDAHGRLTRLGYHWIRVSQALVGAGATLLLFSLARRLASPGVGLLAAGLLAASPRTVHAGAIFKPDVELLAATLLALLAGWWAASRPAHAGRYLLAGVGVGLATGAKLNGLVVALPLVLATLLRWRETARWLGLALAGVASFATFWLFNPHIAQILRALRRNELHYRQTATGGPLDVLAKIVRYPFDADFLGPLIGAFAVLGAAVLLVWTLRRRGSAGQRLGWWMVLSYPVAYYAVYVALSPRAKANHFLQIIPFTALFAAVVLVAGGIAIGRLLLGTERRRRARLAGVVGAILVVGLPAGRSSALVYQLAVPTTWELAQGWVEHGLRPPRRAYRVLVAGTYLEGREPGAPAYEPLAAAAAAAADDLRQADALIVDRGGLGPGVRAAVARWASSGGKAKSFAPAWLRRRGPEVSAWLHPHRMDPGLAGRRVVFAATPHGDLLARLPETTSPGQEISLRVRLRLDRSAASDLRLLAGGESHRWIAGPAARADVFFLSARFPAPRERLLRIAVEGGRLQKRANAELFGWSRR